MKIFSVTIVQDQEDIIEENIRHHQSLFDDLYIWDIGSVDSTVEIIKRLSCEFDNVHPKYEKRQFSNDLRGELFGEIKHKYNENDWYYQLDSDEFLYSNIKSIVANANNENKFFLRSYHLNFRLRVDEISTPFINTSSRQYFKVEYSEVRAFKNVNSVKWPLNDRSILPLGNILPINLKRPHREFVVIYHYPFRSQEQLQKRIESKRKLVEGSSFKEIKGINYNKYKITDINTLISKESDLRDIKKSNKIFFSEKLKIKFKTIYKPLMMNYLNKIEGFLKKSDE